VRWNADDGEDVAAVQRVSGFLQTVGAYGDLHRSARIQRLDDLAAEPIEVVVDDGDRHVAQNLGAVRLRIEHAIDDGRKNEQAEGCPVGKHAAPLSSEAGDDAARGGDNA